MEMTSPQTRVAILGSGGIGLDLMFKVKSSSRLKLAFLVGRNKDSKGLGIAKAQGVETSSDGLDFLQDNVGHFDLVFDATSAASHGINNRFFQRAGKFAIDLTPAKVGELCVPSINLDVVNDAQNVNPISCGGQASLPLAHALAQAVDEVEYLEVVSTISSLSAGMATRENINEYMTTTEYALALFAGAKKTKAILNINPAEPGVSMQTTLYARAKYQDFSQIEVAMRAITKKVQAYVPGYQLVLQPMEERGQVTVSLTVRGSGDYLPSHAGNLDIINCAAVAVAEHKHATLSKETPCQS
ncbi:MAG: acetaldehyde dehydrogenase (acetylating) [Burkholderiaceae bacterium]|nr:acetaldehyde dehydrogenase (acetylating) [Burkholderiaceae bacterium]